MGLFKSEVVPKGSPFGACGLKTEFEVVEIVFDRVRWYNCERLNSSLDRQTPEEYEANLLW
ncbi:IS3 family transposase [Neomicrococcus lactis]|uniref:IS3 family transposase n=1 Tax=Neomicrococcus lactis TaxID=732241 RepID=UPI003A5C878E